MDRALTGSGYPLSYAVVSQAAFFHQETRMHEKIRTSRKFLDSRNGMPEDRP
jgi:hypothetical protein